ncbi:phage ORF5 protein [Nocardia mangyaensis]|uniref:phage ORF5 protein n=1 Tax=Nocardia mangyaensis TaxID=2213200 RepID=UPI0026776269|nr:phage ORF5 protein [Nocardia mangyaensis]MDO3651329.1 hypothetical protein [Nocardia mangyaensis]
MIKKIFTVYDEKSEAYLQPFFLDTIGQASRAMTDCCNDLNHQFNRHTADYSLFQLGEYDDQTATINYNKKSLGSLLEYKTNIQAENMEETTK